jgi:hypothetical protein
MTLFAFWKHIRLELAFSAAYRKVERQSYGDCPGQRLSAIEVKDTLQRLQASIVDG